MRESILGRHISVHDVQTTSFYSRRRISSCIGSPSLLVIKEFGWYSKQGRMLAILTKPIFCILKTFIPPLIPLMLISPVVLRPRPLLLPTTRRPSQLTCPLYGPRRTNFHPKQHMVLSFFIRAVTFFFIRLFSNPKMFKDRNAQCHVYDNLLHLRLLARHIRFHQIIAVIYNTT